MQSQRVLVTGGAGAIGSTIVDLLVSSGVGEVVVLDKLQRGSASNLISAMARGNVSLIDGDICDPEVVHECMRDVDIVFHQAGLRVTTCAQEPRLAFDVLATGTFNVAEAAAAAGVKKVIAASSACVYGMAEQFPTPETQHPYANDTLYGAAKTFNEGMFKSFHATTGLDYVALRYFNVYGPRMAIRGPDTEVLVKWMERIANGEPPAIHGDGSGTTDFIHIEDVARANILAAGADVSDVVFNIGSGKETSLLELASLLLEIMGSDLSVDFGPERSVNKVPRRQADISRAQELLGFQPAIDLYSGLQQLVQWWSEQRDSTVEPSVERVSQ